MKVMDLLELKQKRDFFKKDKDFENALNVSHKIWEIEKSDWNLYFLVKFLRKTKRFNDARSLLDTNKIYFPSFKLLENEELWLDYSQKIYNWVNNSNFIEDAEFFLDRLTIQDNFKKEIYISTKFNMISYLMMTREYNKALDIIESLDLNILSNRGNSGLSQLKIYFKLLVDIILELGIAESYIRNLLDKLNFTSNKTNSYIDEIFKKTESELIKSILMSTLLSLKDEINFRDKKIFRFNYIENKITTVGNLSDFIFCPVAFAINFSYDVIPTKSLNIEDYTDQKWTLGRRYFEYQKSQSINHTFYDFENNLDTYSHNSFMEIFSSRLLFNSYQNFDNNFFFKKSNDTLRGIPDYIFQNKYGQKFVVIEKFTRRKSNNESFFINDKIKLLAHMFELTSSNVDFGYLIYWEYTTEYNVQKVIGCNIIKVGKEDEEYNLLKRVIYDLNIFKYNKRLYIDNHQILLTKCLRCSVKHYCNHKTGRLNNINLPYNVEEI